MIYCPWLLVQNRSNAPWKTWKLFFSLISYSAWVTLCHEYLVLLIIIFLGRRIIITIFMFIRISLFWGLHFLLLFLFSSFWLLVWSQLPLPSMPVRLLTNGCFWLENEGKVATKKVSGTPISISFHWTDFLDRVLRRTLFHVNYSD